MEYRIEIQDIDNLEDELILHFSEKDSINLTYEGGDDKTQPIIGSVLDFSLLVDDCESGKYEKYFTEDEKKWRVRFILNSDDSIIWTGFLLPETYSEPYANNTFFVNFSATDGIGLLKGQEIPKAYKNSEVGVLDFLLSIINLTGIPLRLYVSTAILNSNSGWNNITIDTSKFDDDTDTHQFLESILHSMRCILYQSNNHWYVEGINKRNFITNNYDIVRRDTFGNLLITRTKESKNVKELSWVSYPEVSMNPKLKKIIVTHEREELALPDEVVEQKMEDFEAEEHASVNYFYPFHWDFFGGYEPEVEVANGYLFLGNYAQNEEINLDRRISLREKLYVQKGYRLKINIDFELTGLPDNTEDVDEDDLLNYAVFRIKINDDVIFFNNLSYYDEEGFLRFNVNGNGEVELFHNVKQNGYLSIEFFEPFGDYDMNMPNGYLVKDLTVENLNEEGDNQYTIEIDENYSQVREIDLPISNDITALSPSFYIGKIKSLSPAVNATVNVDIYNTFQQNGDYYYVLDIKGATLVNRFLNDILFYPDSSSSPEAVETGGEVIYNFNGSEEHVFKTSQNLTGSNPFFVVNYKLINQPSINRAAWLEWSDAVYGNVERKEYNRVVAEIEEKLYSVDYIQVEGDVKDAVKINDIVKFRYKNEWKYFIVTDCSWNVGGNVSTVFIQEAVYDGNSFGNIPPYANAGRDILLGESSTQVVITDSNAFDPDGEIESIEWTKISGGNSTIEDSTVLHPIITGLTGDSYVFQIEVTDNSGNVSTDTVNINRTYLSTIQSELIESDFEWPTLTDPNGYSYGKYSVFFNPDIQGEYSVNLNYRVFNYFEKNRLVYNVRISCVLEKNGQQYRYELNSPDEEVDEGNPFIDEKGKVFRDVISARRDDEIFVYLIVQYKAIKSAPPNPSDEYGLMRTQIDFESYERTNGFQTITNLPFGIEFERIESS